MTVPPNVKYADLFVKFQREAREQGKGLWGIAPLPATGGGVGKQGSGTHYVGNARSKVFHCPRASGRKNSPAQPGGVQEDGGGSGGRVQAVQGCRP